MKKLPLIIADIDRRLEALEKPKASTNDNLNLFTLIEPTIVKGNIFIPLLGRTLAVEYIDNEEAFTWGQAMHYCESNDMELPSKEDTLILIWQIDKINALLKQLGKDEIGYSWGWTKSESSATTAWCWNNGRWSNGSKSYIYYVVPFLK